MSEQQNGPDERTASADKSASKAASSEGSTLDDLLKEYEQDGDRAKTRQQPDSRRFLSELKPVIDFAKTAMSERQAKAIDDELKAAYEFMTEDEDLKGFKPVHLRGFMEAYNIEQPSFGEAFMARQKDPTAWKAALAKGRDWLKAQLKDMPGASMKSDLAAAKASVAGTSTQDAKKAESNAAELFAMSDAEYQAHISKLLSEARG